VHHGGIGTRRPAGPMERHKFVSRARPPYNTPAFLPASAWKGLFVLHALPRIAIMATTLLGTLALLAGLETAPAAAATPPALTLPQIYWGATIDGPQYGDGVVPADMRGVATFESHAGKNVSLIPMGDNWQRGGVFNPFPTSYFDNIRGHGAIPMYNWQSTGDNPADFQNAIITSGKYDSYIHAWAQAARAWGHPFFLRFDHEMNGWWYAWGNGQTSPGGPVVNGNQVGDYVPMYRHVHDIFVQEGVTNVTWVWSINHEAINSQYPPLSAIYPGDAYVDWTSIDAFNMYAGTWLTFNAMLTGQGTTWMSNTYQSLLNVAPLKPIILSEFGTEEANSSGTVSGALATTAGPAARAKQRVQIRSIGAPRLSVGVEPAASSGAASATVQPPAGAVDKPSWLRDTFLTELVYNFPAIKAVVYFNWGIDHPDIPIESSPAAQTAFAQGITSPLYPVNTFGGLQSSPILPLTTQVDWFAPVADTYITRNAPHSTSGGSSQSLVVKGGSGGTADAFLKFDLSALAGRTLDQVVLQLTSTGATNASSDGTINVRYVSNNSWSEQQLSWSSSVPAGSVSSTVSGTLIAPTTVSTTYTIKLPVSLVQANVGGQLSLELDESSTDDFVFASREVTDASRRPELILAYR
jgi:Glycosyl hydrolase family 26